MIEPAPVAATGPVRAQQRLGLVAVLSLMIVVVAAGPAWADPAGPTNYRSVVTTVDPRPAGVTIEVIGGDAFLSVALAEGHTMEVPGYFGEPYLRIDADGTVWLNTLSPARWINRDRYGLSGVPDFADSEAEPEWEQVGDRGRFAWHDHRIHWMSFDLPPTVTGDRPQTVFPWSIDLTIDGQITTVQGELLWFPSTNPSGPLLIGLVGLLPLARHRRGRVEAAAYTAAGFGALGLFVATTQYAATPVFDRVFPIDPLFPAFAVVMAFAALLMTQPIRRWGAGLLAGIALVWWAVKVATTLTAPILATALPTALERLGVALPLWAGIGVVGVAGFELVVSMRVSGATLDENPT